MTIDLTNTTSTRIFTVLYIPSTRPCTHRNHHEASLTPKTKRTNEAGRGFLALALFRPAVRTLRSHWKPARTPLLSTEFRPPALRPGQRTRTTDDGGHVARQGVDRQRRPHRERERQREQARQRKRRRRSAPHDFGRGQPLGARLPRGIGCVFCPQHGGQGELMVR